MTDKKVKQGSMWRSARVASKYPYRNSKTANFGTIYPFPEDVRLVPEDVICLVEHSYKTACQPQCIKHHVPAGALQEFEPLGTRRYTDFAFWILL